MSAPSCLVFYGIQAPVPEAERATLEARINPETRRARRMGLDFYWGVFEKEDKYLKFLGRKIAMLGPEDVLDFALDAARLIKVMADVDTRLVDGGVAEAPRLWFKWMPNE